MNQNTIALLEILQNDSVALEISNASSIDEVLSILKTHGLDISAEDLKGITLPLKTALEEDQLTEDSLAYVAGGVNWWKVVKAVAGIVSAIAGYFS